jgi:hypothetical protein
MNDRDELLSRLDQETRDIFVSLSDPKQKLVLGNWHELDDPATLVHQLHRKKPASKMSAAASEQGTPADVSLLHQGSLHHKQHLQRQHHQQELQDLEQRQQQRRRKLTVSAGNVSRKSSAPVILGSNKSHDGKDFAETIESDAQTAEMFYSLTRSKQTMIRQNWYPPPLPSSPPLSPLSPCWLNLVACPWFIFLGHPFTILRPWCVE